MIEASYDEFDQLSRRVVRLRTLANKSEWDLEAYAPEDGAVAIGTQLGELEATHQQVLASSEMERAIGAARRVSNLTARQEADLREVERWRSYALPLSGDHVREMAEATTTAKKAWQAAKRGGGFEGFKLPLEKLVALKRKEARLIDATRDPYETLMGRYEPGVDVSHAETLFSRLKEGLVPLIEAIRRSGVDPDRHFVGMSYIDKTLDDPYAAQKRLNYDLVRRLGLPEERTRVIARADQAFHPLTVPCGSPFDVRISTRLFEDNPVKAILAVIHEAGHALYELGMDDNLLDTPTSDITSMGMHESQSILWERHVGRSYEFWQYFFPKLQEAFPNQLKGYDARSFYTAVNAVQPSLIRVEADEATYCLHILLRFELEKALIHGDIGVADLPRLWNDKMEEYLGVQPTNNVEGVLQDIHWSHGLFGYFPTYAIGAVRAAQIFKTLSSQVDGLDDQIRKGEFTPLRELLRERMYRHGQLYLPEEAMMGLTGKQTDTEAFLTHLTDRYGNIYSFQSPVEAPRCGAE